MCRQLCFKKNTKAFTLVELSIVIVIIGLIIAGVTAGNSLVASAQKRSLITQVESLKAAITSFELQYNALPGDLANASSYWLGVNNGNNNRSIDNNVAPYEFYFVMNHLSKAGLVPEPYTYAATWVPGTNVAKCKGGLVASCGVEITSQAYSGAKVTIGYTGMHTSVLSGKDSYFIDQKMDDGNPHIGKIFVNFGTDSLTNGTHCMSAAVQTPPLTTATYVLTDTVPHCRMYFQYFK